MKIHYYLAKTKYYEYLKYDGRKISLFCCNHLTSYYAFKLNILVIKTKIIKILKEIIYY